MFIKLSYEPHVRENAQLHVILQEAASYPWHLLDYSGIEGIFDWYVTSTEPSAILCLNSEHSSVDNSILKWVSFRIHLRLHNILISFSCPAYFKRLRVWLLRRVIRFHQWCKCNLSEYCTWKQSFECCDCVGQSTSSYWLLRMAWSRFTQLS